MILSKRRTSLKASLLLLIFSLGSVSVSGTILPLPISDAHKTTGNFILMISPTSISVPPGANGTSTITITSTQGFAGTVSLSAQFNNAAMIVSFNPTSITVTAGTTSKSIATIQAAKNATMGDYNIIITGTSHNGRKILSSSALLTFAVDSQADFRVQSSPQSLTLIAGFSNTTSIILTSTNGFSGSVSLYATVPFGFIGIMGGQNQLTLTSGSATSTTLQVSSTISTTPGKYNITVTGVSGSLTHSNVLALTVVAPLPESLTLTGSSILSPTEMSLSLQNNGNTPVTLTSYVVADTTTDSWMLLNWNGPVISSANAGQGIVFIGASCPTCTYSGVPFAFQQFVSGHTYTVSVTTRLNSTFTFSIAVP